MRRMLFWSDLRQFLENLLEWKVPNQRVAAGFNGSYTIHHMR